MQQVKTLGILFCIFFFPFQFIGQVEECISPGDALDLNAIEFLGCSGPLTFDVSSSNFGLNCTDCGPLIYPTNSENIEITAYSDGNQCGDESVTITFIDADFTYTEENSPDCNSFDFSGSTTSSVTSWQWDFNGDNVTDASGQNVSWNFTNNGNQNVSLTVTSSNGCSYTTFQNIFIGGPWAELTVEGNLDADDEYTVLDVISYSGNDCTIPFCVDDLDEEHCLIFNDINHPNPNGNISYNITVDNVNIYSNGAGVPPSALSHCFPANTSGNSTIVYEIVDNSGCVFTKTYTVYISESTTPDTDLINLTPSPDGYCLDQVIQIEFTAAATNPEDVTYILAISCPTFNFYELIPVFIDTLYLSPGQTEIVNWPVSNSSCECDFGQFAVLAFVTNPCSVTPIFSSSFAVDVPLDTEASFSAPDLLCQDDSYTFFWEGSEFLGNGACDADIEWTVTDPGGTLLPDAGDDEDFTWTFDQIGEYEICLEIDGDCNSTSSTLCETICVQPPITPADLDVSWPDISATTICENDTYNPTVNIDLPLCEEPNYLWYVTPNTGVSIAGATTTNPTITFSQKGDYVVHLNANALPLNCGSPSVVSETIAVAAPPQITTNTAVLQGCPGEVLCLDEAFCVDDCNADFTVANMTIYEGTAADCNVAGLTQVWSAPNAPLVTFPSEMNGLDCLASNAICDFGWDVPSDAGGDYVVLIELTNGCGSVTECIPIDIINPDDLTIDFQTDFCVGETFDPSTTSFNTCTWYDGATVIWDGVGIITMNEDMTITISCTGGACPISVDVDITVDPLPIVSISGGSNLCVGDDITLESTPGFVTYQWHDVSCVFINSSNEIIGETDTDLTISTPGIYSVVVSDANGCSNCTEIEIEGDSPPVFDCNSLNFCETETAELIDLSCLSAPGGGWGGSTPEWTVSVGADLIVTGISDPYSVLDLLDDYADFGVVLDMNTTFTFSYTWTSPNGCDHAGSFTVEITAAGQSTQEITNCTGIELDLGGDGSNGTWTSIDLPASAGGNFVGTQFNWIPDAIDVGTYTLNFESGSGCSTIAYEIEVFLSPTVSTVVSDNNLCGGSDVAIIATSGFTSYQWHAGSCALIGAPIAGEISETITISDAGSYVVVIADSNGCEACSEEVIVNDEAPVFDCIDLNFCEIEVDEIIDLSCLQPPPNGWGTDPVWSINNNGAELSNDIGWSYTVQNILDDFGTNLTTNEDFSFVYTWTSAAGCEYQDSLVVTLLFEGITNENLIQCNDVAISLPADGSNGTWDLIDLPASAGMDFTGTEFNWTPTGTDAGGTYHIEFISGFGCSSINYEIEVFENPTFNLTVNSGNSGDNLCAGQDLTLEATTGFDNYTWYEGDCALTGAVVNDGPDDAITINTAGFFSVQITDENGCLACEEVEVIVDNGPTFDCIDLVLCEIDVDTEIDLDCLQPPLGGWGATNPIWTNTANDDLLNPNVTTPYNVQGLMDDLDDELLVDTDFILDFSWTSASGCEYSDSLIVTILNEGITYETVEVCSNDTISLVPDGSIGYWEIINISATPDTIINATSFTWNTEFEDVGDTHEIIFYSGLGCSSFNYELVVNETPSGTISVLTNDICLADILPITLDPGIATNEILEYQFGMNTENLDVLTAQFDPTSLGLNPEDDGLLYYMGSIDYPTSDSLLTCFFEATTPVVIADFPESLFVPSFLCEGEEFEIAPCDDPYIDNFQLTVGDTIYSVCPIELSTLNGLQTFDLSVNYGGVLGCIADTAGTISIQEQLAVTFTSEIDSCTALAQVGIEITGGIMDQINFDPPGIFTDGVLEQTINLPILDENQDQPYLFDVSIGDGVCDVLEFEVEGLFIAPLVPLIFIENGPYCSGEVISFNLGQVGSNVVDSVIVYPGNGDPNYTWIDDDYAESADFLYLSPIDSTLFTVGFELFNPCHDTLVTLDFIVEAPQLIASMEPEFAVCSGGVIDFAPVILGAYNDFEIIVPANLNLSLVDVSDPFSYEVNSTQEAGFYPISIVLTPNCGDPIVMNSILEVYAIEEPEVTYNLNCSGLPSTFQVTNPPLSETYQWVIEGQLYSGAQVGAVFSSTGIFPINLITTDDNGCTSTITFEVDIPGVAVAMPFESLGGCEDIYMQLSTDLGPNETSTWTISNNITSDVAVFYVNNQFYNFINPDLLVAVDYTVNLVVEDPEGCSSSANSYVSIYPDGNAEILVSEDQENWSVGGQEWVIRLDDVCSEEKIYFKDSFNSNQCSWSSPLNECNNGSLGACPVYPICLNENENGTIVLETTNSYGCQATDSIAIVPLCGTEVVFYIPNAITADNDGINDFFYVEGKNFDPDKFNMKIYNRWGEVIFETNDYKEKWVGNVNGGGYYAQDDVFTYVINTRHKLTKERTREVGMVVVIR